MYVNPTQHRLHGVRQSPFKRIGHPLDLVWKPDGYLSVSATALANGVSVKQVRKILKGVLR